MVSEVSVTDNLCGFTVGVTADRRGDEQAIMLRRLGVEVLHGPAIRTLPLVDDPVLRTVTEAMIADPPQYLVANTGLGVRSWFGMASTWDLDTDLRNALARTRIVCRGPKAAGAILIAGLKVWWRSPSEQLDDVVRFLIEQGIAGERIAFQLHGDRRESFGARLQEAGAVVLEIPVYRWTLPEDAEPALRLIEACCSGRVDAITFTAGPAVQNFFALADAAHRADDLRRVLNERVVIACVGPVCAEIAITEGLRTPVVPTQWRLGSLVRLVGRQLAEQRHRYLVDEHELVLQGTVAIIDGAVVHLTDRERRVLEALTARPGVTVARAALLREVWHDPGADPHGLETVIGRLRAKLGVAGTGVVTVVRRGYRFAAVPLPLGGSGKGPLPPCSRSPDETSR